MMIVCLSVSALAPTDVAKELATSFPPDTSTAALSPTHSDWCDKREDSACNRYPQVSTQCHTSQFLKNVWITRELNGGNRKNAIVFHCAVHPQKESSSLHALRRVSLAQYLLSLWPDRFWVFTGYETQENTDEANCCSMTRYRWNWIAGERGVVRTQKKRKERDAGGNRNETFKLWKRVTLWSR